MDSRAPGLPKARYSYSIDSGQPVSAGSSQAQHAHPELLQSINLSSNVVAALNQTENLSNGHAQLMALLTYNGINEQSLTLCSSDGADAHYLRSVEVPNENRSVPDIADLTVSVRRNDQNRYDLVGIRLRARSTGNTDSIVFVVPPAASARPGPFSFASTRPAAAPRCLAEQYSQAQLLRALNEQNNPQDFSGNPLPSGSSAHTDSMVFSQSDRSGIPTAPTAAFRPSRTGSADGSRSAPSSTASESSQQSTRQGKLPHVTDKQIDAYLRDENGDFRPNKEVAAALHQNGMRVARGRITKRLQAARGPVKLPAASDAQVKECLYDEEGKLRKLPQIRDALNKLRVGAGSNRLTVALQAERGVRHRPSASDKEIRALLRDGEGNIRTIEQIKHALYKREVGASHGRIDKNLRDELGVRHRPGASDEDSRAAPRRRGKA